LCSLPIDVKIAREELEQLKQQHKGEHDTADLEDNESQMLSASLNAVEEIQVELASLAGDERCSQQIERLATIACDKSLGNSYISARRLLHGLSGYYLHLSCHRYGSHVAQTILVLCAAPHFLQYEQKQSQEDMHDKQEGLLEGIPSIHTLILGAANELLPQTRLLATHVCGSHALRALICSLVGVSVVNSPTSDSALSQLRTKKKKKKNPSTSSDNLGGRVGNIKVSAMPGFIVPEELSNRLKTLIESLLGCEMDRSSVGDDESIRLLCHPSSGPTMSLLVQGMAAVENCNSSLLKDGIEAPTDIKSSVTQTRRGIVAPEARFAPDSKADLFVRCILHCADPKKCSDIIYGLSGETYGSRFLETVLCTAHDELYHNFLEGGAFIGPESSLKDYALHDVSNFVVQTVLRTARTREQVDEILKALLPLVLDGSLIQPNRRGVLWRLVEMSANWRIGQESLLKAIPKGFESSKLLETPCSMKECIVPLLTLQAPQGEGLRLQMDVNGARVLFNLLRFVPRLCKDVLDGIIDLHSDLLVAVAKDGLGSCCILDAVLEGPTKENPFKGAIMRLFKILRGNLVSLSVDRLGHHTITKLFEALNFDAKLELAEELLEGKNRLGGSSIGRNVMHKCYIRELIEDGEDGWKEKVKKDLAKNTFVQDIVESEKIGKKKRKRKRKAVGDAQVTED